MPARLGLSVAVAALTLLLIEGALSLLGTATLGDRFAGRGTGTDAARESSAPAGGPDAAGAFVPHPDPRVNHVLQPDAHIDFQLGARSDGLGMRARPAAPVGEDPFRIAVVGDSVAFGWGLRDDEVLAHRLETLLADLRPRGAPPVECRTVGLPAWNHWNSLAFLGSHLHELQPDLVLYLPIPNDLSDATVMSGPNTRRQPPDLHARDPWFRVAYNGPFLMALLARRQQGELTLPKRATGPVALETDLSPESRRRFDEMAGNLRDTAARLDGQGITFAVLPYQDDDFTAVLLDRFARIGFRPRVIPLVEAMTTADQLQGDPHPNAETVAAFAHWIAGDLIDAQLLPAGEVPWPGPAELSGRLAGRRAAHPDWDGLRRRADEARMESFELLQPRFDTTTGTGAKQVYGGLHADGVVETRLLCVLRRIGGRLRVEIEALPDRPDALPLEVEVFADGASLGRLRLSDPGEHLIRALDLPEGGPTVEVKLVPDLWVAEEHGDHWRLVSFRLGSLAVLPD